MEDRIPLRRQKISEQITEEIRARIRSGQFAPGTKLPTEAEMAAMFDVSRSSVREALSVLAAAHIVESRQGEGTWVNHVDVSSYIQPIALSVLDDHHQALELLEARQIVESEAAALAARRATQEDLAAIAGAQAAFSRETLAGGTGERADYTFHRLIVRAARNAILVKIIDNIADLFQEGLRYTLRQNVGHEERRSRVIAEHAAIHQALQRRDEEAARRAMIHHLEGVRQKLLRAGAEQREEQRNGR